ncbi:MAG TPA: CRISPR-associated endoribonuclease Cas6 [Cyanobacteria bacterium UBA8803]|nr:CRISPR-associated endoribonuclease Cas6 [Cyanobacteria bacterium UBA8803]
MPASLLIHFFPKCEFSRSAASGKWLHGLVYELFDRLDPDYAEQLHKRSDYKPFTLSPLLVAGKGNTVNSGQSCRVGLTLLDEDRLAEFLNVLADVKPLELNLANTPISLDKVEVASQEGCSWVCYQSWQELLEIPGKRFITLKWHSPTAIKQQHRNSLFPIPETLFNSWQQRWAKASPLPLPQVFSADDWFSHSQISDYQLETTTVRFGEFKQKGFKGWATYEITGNESMQQTAAILSRFAFFCGTGYKTTIGMGQTTREE